MNTYLLTWNPDFFPEEDFKESQIKRETSSFSIANNRKIASRGDRVLLVRTGKSGVRGVVAAGYILGATRDTGRDPWRHQVPIKWVVVQLAPIITHQELYKRDAWHWDDKGWSPQSGGRIVPENVAQAVWEEIEKRKDKKMPVDLIEGVEYDENLDEEFVDEAADPYEVLESIQEGARIRVESNRAERDPKARERCLGKHGFTCACCDMDFFSNYGAPVTLVHVHHLKPVGARGKSEKTAVKDLATVCPNCHAVIHSQDPPLTPKEVRQMWLDGGQECENDEEYEEIEVNKGDVVAFEIQVGKKKVKHKGVVVQTSENATIVVKVGKDMFEITADQLIC